MVRLPGSDHGCFTVDRTRGGECDASNAVRTRCFENIKRRDRVLLQVLARMVQAETHVSVRREMKDNVAPAHRLRQAFDIEKICLLKNVIGVSTGALNEFDEAAGKVVVADDLRASF